MLGINLWNLWPHYIKICSKVGNVMNGTSDDTPLKFTTKTNEVDLEM